MKMTKLLASGVAASLAASSLAAIASAEPRTFSMGKTQGIINFTMRGGDAVLLGDQYYLTDEEFTKRTKTLGISETGSTDRDSFDDFLLVSVNKNIKLDSQFSNVSLDVSGIKISLAVTGVQGTRGGATGGREYTYELKPFKTTDGKATSPYLSYGTQATDPNGNPLYVLPVYATNAPDGGFLPEQYLEITKLQVKVEGATAKITTTSKTVYDDWGKDDNWGIWNKDWANAVSLYQGFEQDVPILKEVEGVMNCGSAYQKGDRTTEVVYPFLKMTDGAVAGSAKDQKLGREEILVLSDTNAYNSTGATAGGDKSNQSYINDDVYNGETKHDFDGLAGQVASFFNKQTNGTITFKFTTPAAAASTDAWVSGGVPSTQVGFKYLSEVNASPNDFALFLNYKQTGDLQAITSLDTSAGTVTFDISDILDALGGQTNGVIDNIYYGLTKGITYDKVGTGLYVEEITLSYDEDANADDEIEDDTNDDDEDDDEDDYSDDEDDDEDDANDDDEDDADDDDEDDDDEDDDNTPSVSVDKEDNNTNNNNSGVNGAGDTANNAVVTPADDNPNTGVALAVVPAIVAAAAVVVSKKRK